MLSRQRWLMRTIDNYTAISIHITLCQVTESVHDGLKKEPESPLTLSNLIVPWALDHSL